MAAHLLMACQEALAARAFCRALRTRRSRPETRSSYSSCRRVQNCSSALAFSSCKERCSSGVTIGIRWCTAPRILPCVAGSIRLDSLARPTATAPHLDSKESRPFVAVRRMTLHRADSCHSMSDETGRAVLKWTSSGAPDGGNKKVQCFDFAFDVTAF